MAAKLDIVIGAVDKASGTLEKVGGKAGKLGSMMGTAMKAGALAGGAALAGAGVAALKMGLDFEKSMAEVKTLMPDISEKAFGKMKSDVLDLSKEMGIATTEAVPALYQAISAGVPKENVADFMTIASKAAIGGVTDLETAVDGITSVTNAYGLENVSAQKAADVMFNAVKAGKTDFNQLSGALYNVIPTAASLGVGFEDVTAQLASLTAQGTPTSVATTQIRAAMVEAGKGGSKLDTAIQALAGKSFPELIKEGKSMPEIFNDLRGSMPEQDFKDLFGSVEAVNAVLGVTGPNFEKTMGIMDDAKNSAGAVDAAFDTMSQTASFKLNKAINYVKVSLTELGAKALPYVIKGVEEAGKFVKDKLIPPLREWWSKHGPAIIKTLQGIQAVLKATMLPALKTLGGLLTNTVFPALAKVFNFLRENKEILAAVALAITAIMVPAMVAWAASVWAYVTAEVARAAATIAANLPLFALIAILAAVAYGIIMLIKHWDDIVAFITGTVIPMFENLWAKIDTFLSNLPLIGAAWEAVKQIIADKIDAIIGIVQGLIDFATELISFFKHIFKGEWGAAWDSLKEMAKIALNLLLDYLQLTFIGTIRSVLSALNVWDLVKSAFNTVREGAIGTFQTVLDFIKGLPAKLGTYGQTFYNAGKGLFTRLANGAVAGVNALISVVESGINFLIRKWNDLSLTLPSIDTGIPGVGTIGGGTISTPNIGEIAIPRVPELQWGGYVERTGMAVVHEGERFSRGGEGVIINGPVTIITQDPEDFLRQLRRYAAA